MDYAIMKHLLICLTWPKEQFYNSCPESKTLDTSWILKSSISSSLIWTASALTLISLFFLKNSSKHYSCSSTWSSGDDLWCLQLQACLEPPPPAPGGQRRQRHARNHYHLLTSSLASCLVLTYAFLQPIFGRRDLLTL